MLCGEPESLLSIGAELASFSGEKRVGGRRLGQRVR
jgi:hypothetical protein